MTGPGQVAVRRAAEPTIERPTDALLPVTSTAVCGSDLHVYHQRLGEFVDQVSGHWPLGGTHEFRLPVSAGATRRTPCTRACPAPV